MTQAQRFRYHFDARPLGPADCLRTRQEPADCRTCGTVLVTTKHTPMRLPVRIVRTAARVARPSACIRPDRDQKEGEGSPADFGLDSAATNK